MERNDELQARWGQAAIDALDQAVGKITRVECYADGIYYIGAHKEDSASCLDLCSMHIGDKGIIGLKHGKDGSQSTMSRLFGGVQVQHQDSAVVNYLHRGADNELDLLDKEESMVGGWGLRRK